MPTRKKRVRVQKSFNTPSLTRQSDKDACNINTIMRQYEKTGVIDHLNQNKGDYGNFIGFKDYHSSLNQILAADEMFQTIPAQIRGLFDNDAGKFLHFAQNPENHSEMVKLGLATQRASEPAVAPTPPEATKTTKEVIDAATAAPTPPADPPTPA